MTAKSMGRTEWVLLVFLSLLWGGSFFFSKVALTELRPLTVVFGRVSLAALVLRGVLAMGHATHGNSERDTLRAWAPFAGMGLLNNLIPFSLIFWGQTHIPSGLASILNSTTPLFAVVLAHCLTKDEKLTPHRMVGVLLSLGGVITMIGPAAMTGLGVDVLAQVAVLGAAISYACAGIFGRRFKSLPPLVTASRMLTATAVMVFPIMLAVDRPWTLSSVGIATVMAVVALAVLSTALAYVIYFRILAAAGATNVLLVTFLMPVVALALGMSILGESLEARHYAGMGLIGLGLSAIDGRLWRRAPPAEERHAVPRK